MTQPALKLMPSGKAFEIEITDLLRTGGFRVASNVGAARPRQTDVYAQAPGVDLLVEVKDRKRKIDVADVDSLRARLGRTAADVVGAIFTRSSITRGAMKEIESDRTREIIVFLEEEIEQLRRGKAQLLNLVDRKRQELRVQGRAWFRSANGEYADIELPQGLVEFYREGNAKPYFHSRAGFAHASYALKLPDTGWGRFGGEGARLPMRLTLNTIDDMRDLLGYLHDRFGLSSDGSFSIHQSGACWHGVGVDNFLSTASNWRNRYTESLMERIHHSEDLVYFDQFRDGWLLLSTRQRVHADDDSEADSYLHSSELAIQLPGIPIDVAPFVELCRYTGNEWAQFQHLGERLTHTLRLKKPIKLEVVGTAVRAYRDRKHDQWVIGLVARNPFFRRRSLPREFAINDPLSLQDLLQIEFLLCDVRDHLPYGDVVDDYFLEGIETTEAHHSQIIRPFGTWNKIVRRSRSQAELRADAQRDLEVMFPEMTDSKKVSRKRQRYKTGRQSETRTRFAAVKRPRSTN